MSSISAEEGRIGNTEAVCPYCSVLLPKFPLAKTKCRECGNFIYSRKRPFDGEKVLLTKEDADKVEYQWAVENDSASFPTLATYHEEKEREHRILASLRSQLGREPRPGELRTAVIKTELLENRARSLRGYRDAGFQRVRILTAGGCENCRRMDGTVFNVSEAPNPPVKECLDEWCRCTYVVEL